MVFKKFLKERREDAWRMYQGRAFHNLGATTLKALAPIVTRRNLEVTKNPSLEDLKERAGT